MVLFGGLAVVLACLLQGKLASLMVLLAGQDRQKGGVARGAGCGMRGPVTALGRVAE